MKDEVGYFLRKNYCITLEDVSSVATVVLRNWFKDLDNGDSHLTADRIADNVVDLANRYGNTPKENKTTIKNI